MHCLIFAKQYDVTPVLLYAHIPEADMYVWMVTTRQQRPGALWAHWCHWRSLAAIGGHWRPLSEPHQLSKFFSIGGQWRSLGPLAAIGTVGAWSPPARTPRHSSGYTSMSPNTMLAGRERCRTAGQKSPLLRPM